MKDSEFLTTLHLILWDLKINPTALLDLQYLTCPFQSAVNVENMSIYLGGEALDLN